MVEAQPPFRDVALDEFFRLATGLVGNCTQVRQEIGILQREPHCLQIGFYGHLY